jgi:hypothetical protein
MAFITLSNTRRIIFNTDLKDRELTGDLYKKSISIFSKLERSRLLAINKFFENPDVFLKDIYKPIKTQDTETFIYEGSTPVLAPYKTGASNRIRQST